MKQTLVAMMLLLAMSAIIRGQVSGVDQSKGVEQTLIRLEQEKDEAHVRGDKAVFERIYADDYTGINGRGGFSSKKDVLEFNATRGPMYESYASEDIAVRVFGDTAVVTGRYGFKYRKPIKGKDDNQYRYTNVYVKRQAGWQIVAAQFTRIDK
ncbi:MAG TPA: nuclear transport factor 2 family protein [Pyrinomonadaceae bacterium]|jgi:ketosteroid isomerase-like protein